MMIKVMAMCPGRIHHKACCAERHLVALAVDSSRPWLVEGGRLAHELASLAVLRLIVPSQAVAHAAVARRLPALRT